MNDLFNYLKKNIKYYHALSNFHKLSTSNKLHGLIIEPNTTI